MYTNPFNRKHCTIRLIIDKFLHLDNGNSNSSSTKRMGKRGTSSSRSSISSTGSSASNSSGRSFLGHKWNSNGK